MRISRRGAIAATIIVVVGFAIGALLAVLGRSSGERSQTVTIARQSPTAAPESTPAATKTPAPVAPTVQPATAVRTATAAPAAIETRQGSWQLDEANVHVGTIVWVGNAVSNGTTVSLDAHKQSVAGRPAVPCERHTGLRTTFTIGVAQQSVPFRETNCQGTVSTGVVRIQSFSPTNASFSGSFWQDGAMLGTFTARKR